MKGTTPVRSVNRHHICEQGEVSQLLGLLMVRQFLLMHYAIVNYWQLGLKLESLLSMISIMRMKIGFKSSTMKEKLL